MFESHKTLSGNAVNEIESLTEINFIFSIAKCIQELRHGKYKFQN